MGWECGQFGRSEIGTLGRSGSIACGLRSPESQGCLTVHIEED